MEAVESRLQSAIVFYFCLLSNFAWAENGRAMCIVLVWVWLRGGVTLAQRHMQRGLGLNTVTTLTLIAVSQASVFQPCVIKAQESAGFECSHSHS